MALRTSFILWTRFKAKRRNYYLVITHVLLALLVTTRTYTSRDVWAKDSVFVDALWTTSLVISDAFIIMPILLLCGNVVIMVLRLRIEGNSTLGLTNPVKYFDELAYITMIFEVLTLVLNLLNTGMIAYRIWSVRKGTKSARIARSDILTNLVTVLVESAAIYTVVLVVDILLLGYGNSLLLVFIDIQTPLIGIVFSNIIIRVTEGSAFGSSSGTGGNGSRDRTIISTHINRMETGDREIDMDKSYMDSGTGILP
ncbi:hypothetical protein BT96DRAFT_943174 [Gymnopus androsaceus JB14]|uniref:Uncharacterized protein n=1 Tax=Gymnopus androsaceus JB14 TaxID=1447944 RepID=A0A6A4H9L7_9AGAR|nr:hypothetical protein BT96DRAFT_943174 [Gymnopus androsaceus JB14]